MRKQFTVAIIALLFLAVLMVTTVMSVPAKEHRDFRFTGNVTQLWDEPHAGANWTNAFSVSDLNGDDKADVLVLTSSYNEATGTETAKVIAKRGSNGEHLWEEHVTGTEGTNIFAFGAGDLDGDKKEDVLVLISTSETETVIAKRGSDGEHIWTESVSGTVPNLIVSAGDLGEDETGDVLVMMTTSELDMTTFTSNTAARLIAKRGCDGEPLWEEPVDGFGWALSAGDLDGDGMDDVLVQMSSTERDMASGTSTTTATVIAKRGYDGEQLWEEQVTGTELFLFALPAGDLDGDEIADVLLGSHDQVYALGYREE